MFQKIKEFFLGKPKAQETVVEAPYKVEALAAEVAPVTPTPVAEPKKAPVAKPAAAKTPRARKTPAK